MYKISNIIIPIKEEINVFENKLKKIVESTDNFLKDDLIKFMFSNPKRLRPIFIFLFSKILNFSINDNVYNIALASEIIHSASLIHDDIIDDSILRRKNPTFCAEFGTKIAVLEGDLLLSYALMVLSKTNKDTISIYAQRIIDTIQGELKQSSNVSKITDMQTYCDKSFYKTGSLFMAGLESIFTLDNFEPDIKNSLLNFMKKYSLAFQIKNDIDNFSKNEFSDIKNGNYTLPVIYYCMQNSAVKLVDFSNIDFEQYIKLSNKEVQKYKKEALQEIESLNDTGYKKSLIDLCNYTLGS